MVNAVLNRYSRRFGNQETREIKLAEKSSSNPVVGELCKRYEGFIEDFGKNSAGYGTRTETDYDRCSVRLKGLSYSRRDVADFCIMLSKYDGKIAFESATGPFLSALSDMCEDENIEIDLRHLETQINRFGSRIKNIIFKGKLGNFSGQHSLRGSLDVYGDVKSHSGSFMTGGQLSIHGRSGLCTGFFMEGGKIIVYGDVGNSLGEYMKGGTIIVKGNAGKHVGSGMYGGEIIVEGDIESLDNKWKGGQIWHKGRLIRGKK